MFDFSAPGTKKLKYLEQFDSFRNQYLQGKKGNY